MKAVTCTKKKKSARGWRGCENAWVDMCVRCLCVTMMKAARAQHHAIRNRATGRGFEYSTFTFFFCLVLARDDSEFFEAFEKFGLSDFNIMAENHFGKL